MLCHPIPPVFDSYARVLILGSFPSVRSRQEGFFYGHPRNRFWQILGGVFEDDVPRSVEEKIHFLHRHHIALWDVIASCEISGSADSTIRNVIPTDLAVILSGARIESVFTNGRTAEKLYRKYQLPLTGIPSVPLPSSSPANAAWSLPRLTEAWCILRYHEKGEGL